ncbi:MAG: helix-hairpin-helix domain-containing protein [Cystobacterineae bacterium]|nr:helix-hairpin-helix domain-containing protein [Cystobacterineae bacterium]
MAWAAWVVVGGLMSTLYEAPLGDIRSEEDLLLLAERGELSEESLEALLQLWQEGVFPETASKAEFLELPGLSHSEVEALLAHRKKHGRLGGVDAWLFWGLINEAQAQQLRPFIRSAAQLSGRVQLQTAGIWTDERPPPALLSARLASTLGGWGLGGGITLNATRLYAQNLSIQAPGLAYGPSPPLRADAEGFLLRMPSAFAQAQWKNGRLTLGNFRVGFAEKLTLSNSFRQRPHGVDTGEHSGLQRENKRECPAALGSGCQQSEQHYITPDFSIREGYRGLALEGLWPLGGVWEVEGLLWASWQTRDLYQYAFFIPGGCPAPPAGPLPFPPSPNCPAPPVFVKNKAPLRHSYTTLANAYEERLLGMALHMQSARLSFGLVGYMADNRFGLPLQARFQPWAPQLNGAFGALGLHAQARLEAWLLAAEVSRSFDEEGGGGFAAVLRVENETPPQHSGLELRWLSPSFKNPMAKPRSGPDMFWGVRAINEGGLFAHSQWKFPRLLLYASANMWLTLQSYGLTPSGAFHLESHLRLEWQALPPLHPFFSFSSSHHNLFALRQALCTEEADTSSGSLCDALRASVGVKAAPHKNLSLLLRAGGFRKRFVSHPTLWRNGMEAEAELRWKAWRWLAPSLWLLWRQEDMGDMQRFGHLLWLKLFLNASLAQNLEARFSWAFGRAFQKRSGERNDGHMRLELNYRF